VAIPRNSDQLVGRRQRTESRTGALNLKSDDLYWPSRTGTPFELESLRRNATCDVAIIGAGLTGTLIAHELADAGIDVVLLDKRGIGRGSTCASTALVLYEIDVPLCDLKLLRGERVALRSYHLCREAIGQLQKICGTLNNNCQFVPRPSLYLARRRRDLPDLQREFSARNHDGFEVDYLSQNDLRQGYSLCGLGAIRSEEAAEVDPFALTHALMGHVLDRGARAFGGVRVTGIDFSRSRCTLRTDAGHSVSAGYVIVAGGFESMALCRFSPIQLRSTYVMVTQPIAELSRVFDSSLVWEAARPYSYLRTTPDQRIMIGGGDEDFVTSELRDALIGSKTHDLKQTLASIFPDLAPKPAYAWAGTFGDTRDSLPYIGTLPVSSRVLYALCYGANGTNFAIIAANLARDWVRGRNNKDAPVFALDR
jgi:glycine/D-amino acid oxidase-like deaminating enzyme